MGPAQQNVGKLVCPCEVCVSGVCVRVLVCCVLCGVLEYSRYDGTLP